MGKKRLKSLWEDVKFYGIITLAVIAFGALWVGCWYLDKIRFDSPF